MKETFRKFMDGVLSKQAKIQALVNDLGKNFEDELASRLLSCYNKYCEQIM